MKKNHLNARVRSLPLAILLAVAGCSDYQRFEWDDGLGWEAARMRAQEDGLSTMVASLEPGAGPASVPPRRTPVISGDRHVVMPGDTAIGIAEAAGLSLGRFASINRLDPPYSIFVGQVLLTRPLPPGKNTHTVRRGETFMSIANTYGRRLDELRALNPKLDIDRIQAGQTVVIKDVVPARPAAAPQTRIAAKVAPAAPADEGAARRTQRIAATAPVPDLSPKGFLWPVDGTVVTRFGARADGKRSDGIDIRAARGSTVRATESGIVVYAGGDIPSMGRMLMIRHDGGYLSAYAHNETLLVRTGDPVNRGQPVAKVGDTGDVTDPRLHFELRKGKEPLDPLSRLPGTGMRIASSQ
ncbi:MAG: M23 family metallopeptidase [Geminicoccaceae bacterium]|nr:M23 family metallopeptidase [Geminicoccaceae bacterium]